MNVPPFHWETRNMAQNPGDFSAYDAEDPLVGRQRSMP
jgi:hypothetical protein